MSNLHGHDWFGRVCRKCGTTNDRLESQRTCQGHTSTTYEPPTSVYPDPTPFTFDTTPAPSFDSSPSIDTTPSFDSSAFSGGDTGGGGGGSDW